MRAFPSGKKVGGDNIMATQSLAPAVEEVWNTWEIHCLILLSLSLQVFLFLTVGMRRWSSSGVLRTVLWLAYLSADAVAIFVLGHLAVHASEPGHQFMSFWAPFVLVHLGGQDTITAFSKQDNELWTRHLLTLVTQVAVAGYVVAKASWPDSRLKAAMVLMYLSGCFKYAERTYCLYMASPTNLRSQAVVGLSRTLSELKKDGKTHMAPRERYWLERPLVDIISMDAPLNQRSLISVAYLPHLHAEILSNADRRAALYDNVGKHMVFCYQRLYTKTPLRELFQSLGCVFPFCCPFITRITFLRFTSLGDFLFFSFYLCTIFIHVSATIALFLFRSVQKGGQLHNSSTTLTDITVSYILLVGAIVLDASSIAMFMFTHIVQPHLSASPWSQKEWSQKLAQYSMIKMHTTAGMLQAIKKWIGERLGPWGVEFTKVTWVPLITEDHRSSPIKEFILDNLLRSGIRKEWNVASSRGCLALQRCMGPHQESELYKSIRGVDFPTSVLIWHIATDICYYCGDNGDTIDSDQLKKDKKVTRELSKYIMYLVFKCGVMLTTNSQYVHDQVNREIRDMLRGHQLDEKEAVEMLFQDRKVVQASSRVDNATDSHLLALQQSTLEALDSSVILPHARAVAQELIQINDQTARWGLMTAVWSEMLYYTAPRCRGDFHYEHLSTGGEFITHLLLLMSSLGPFLPAPGARADP